MASGEQPFDEREQRWFLAEILKASSISPLDILRLIQEQGIRPNWVEMLIPNGRSVSACMRAYESLLNPPSAPTTSFQPLSAIEQPNPAGKARRKRPPPDEGLPIPGDRTIEAHPFATVNNPGDPAHQFAAPLPSITGEPPQKKRGRPSKEEHERRVREAAQRGEVYPPPKKIKTPRQSLEGIEGIGSAAATAPGMTEGGIAEEGSTSKKKAKKAKSTSAAMHLAPDIPTRISSLEATAKAADRMQIVTEEAVKSTIPETQAFESSAQESLSAGMREQIAREAPDTIQSSSTLIQEPAPISELRMYSATPNNDDQRDTTQKEEEPAS